MCRAAESASTQARDIASKSEVNSVSYRKPTNYMSGGRQHSASSTAPTNRRQTSRRTCLYCGISHQMSKKLCPAVGKRCNKCGKLDHFASRCDSLKKAVHQISHDEGSISASIEFHNTQAVNEIGTVNSPRNSVSAATSKSAPPKARMRVHGKTYSAYRVPAGLATLTLEKASCSLGG